MVLTAVDWIVIAVYFALTLAIGLYYSRRAPRQHAASSSSRAATPPWWLAGTSMVATTFAADTPLAVTGLVRENGIAGNWLWWNLAISGMMTVFFYARLWRRAGVMTDVEFAELRYSGRRAAFLRGFRALYLGVPINCIVLGWVNLAMMKILQVTLGVDAIVPSVYLLGLLLFTAFYTTLAGSVGRAGHRPLSVRADDGHGHRAGVLRRRSAVGGVDALEDKVARRDAAAGVGSRLDFLPAARLGLDAADRPLRLPRASIGGPAGTPAPNPAAAAMSRSAFSPRRTNAHGVLATLWFNVAHYAVRPWPWILTALASIVLYPDLKDPEAGYILIFMDENVFPLVSPRLMIAGFAAAYMSTIATQLNWGASYIVNDFYRRFLVRERTRARTTSSPRKSPPCCCASCRSS